MAKMPILLCAADMPPRDEMRQILESAGHGVEGQVFGHPPHVQGMSPYLVIVDGTRKGDEALVHCRSLRARQGDQFVPILYLTEDSAPETRLACLEAGADAYLARPIQPAELLAQTRALLGIKERHEVLSAKSREAQRVTKRLQLAYQQIDQELELAGRIQEGFLPRTLPQLPGARLAVHYQPVNRVGGDFYDLFRLDETHLGFYVADAMGHGVPASLLTIFVKTSVKAKEIQGQTYRLPPPPEVLEKLNRDLIAQALSDHPFITMVYALFNFQEGLLTFSRAGHPYPIYVPREGPPVLWQMEGSLLGVFETRYKLRTEQLKPGDKVLFHTDGFDAAAFEDHPVGLPSLLAAAAKFRQAPIQELVDQLAGRLFAETKPTDDLTIVGLEMLADN